MTPVALTIAGSDSGGGAGIQADLKTFAALGVFGTSAITCLTAQNPDSVTAVSPVEPAFLEEQIEQVFRFFPVGAAKTGMLFSRELIEVVASAMERRPHLAVVVDPVMVATSGARLLKDDAIDALIKTILPRAALITPNLDEAAVLLGERPTDVASMRDASDQLARSIGRPVLLKGGHLGGEKLTDLLALPDGSSHIFEDSRIEEINTHGSGCTLAAAVAAYLAQGLDLVEAVREARAYLRRGMLHPVHISGRRFIDHSGR